MGFINIGQLEGIKMIFDLIKSKRMEENEGFYTLMLFGVMMIEWNIGFGEGLIGKR